MAQLVNPAMEYELVIQRKKKSKEQQEEEASSEISSTASELESVNHRKEPTPQQLVVPVPIDLIKDDNGCSTLLQCEITQIIKGLLNIEIQLENEEYECVIRQKPSCKPSCPPKPAVPPIPPPPPVEEMISHPSPPIPTPPSPQHKEVRIVDEVFHSTWPRRYGEKWRRQDQVNHYEASLMPLPLPTRKLTKPILRPKTELLAEGSLYVEEALSVSEMDVVYTERHSPIMDQRSGVQLDSRENGCGATKTIDTNPFSMPTMNLEGFTCKTESSESFFVHEEMPPIRASATAMTDKKKKKSLSCLESESEESATLAKMSCDVAIIRHPKSGLVLDGTEFRVKLQHYSGSIYQQWILEPTGCGNFYIINVGSRKLLDLEGAIKKGVYIITYTRYYSSQTQKWFINADHTIVNAADRRLALSMKKFAAGEKLKAKSVNGDRSKLTVECVGYL